jgi:hypothetical protein
MDNFTSEDIYIKINNEKKILKIKKIYYIINNIKNKIVLEFLSKEKYFLKIFDKQIEPINNLSKFIIDNFNIFNPIKINIYNAHNFQKIGKIKETLNLKYCRFLQNSIGCGIIGETIKVQISNNQTPNLVTLTDSNQISKEFAFTINQNILSITIPNDTKKGNYTLELKNNNNEILFSQDYEIHQKFSVSENSLHITNFNASEPLPLSLVNGIDESQEFYFGKKDETPEKKETTKTLIGAPNSTIIITETKLILNRLGITDFLSLYYLYAKNLCDDGLYIIVPIYINSEIKSYSGNALRFNKSITIQFILAGTYATDSIQGFQLRHEVNRSITFESNSSSIKYISKTDQNYTINITFDLTGHTEMLNGTYELRLLNFDEYILQDLRMNILRCAPPLVINDDYTECISCINKNYSYSSESCVNSCYNNEYYLDNICYINCPDSSYKYNKSKICVTNCENFDIDTKEGNGECLNKTFTIDSISPNKLSAETNQIFNLLFEENFPDDRLSYVQINNIAAECNKEDSDSNKEFSCKIDLSSINKDTSEYIIYYRIKKGDNTILNLNSGEKTITIISNANICNTFNQIFNSNLEKCEDCSEGNFYYNNNCVNKCKSYNNSIYKNNTKLICIQDCPNKKEYRDNDNYCVDKCTNSEGYGYINDNKDDCYKCTTYDTNLALNGEKCECVTNYVFNYTGNGKCTLCSSLGEGMIPKNGKCECKDTNSVFNYTGNGKCTLCSSFGEGMVPKNGKCECNETKYVFNYTGDGKCTLCSQLGEGMIPKNGKCECDETKYVFNYTGDGKCTNCSKLGEGMVMKNGKCECDSNYVFNYTGNGKCILCSSLGEGMVLKNGKCECNDTNFVFNYTGNGKCTNCSSLGEGMVMKNGKCECNDTNYAFNYTGDGKCTLCSNIDSNMIVINGKCECKKGTVLSNNNGNTICLENNCSIFNPCKNGICDDSNNDIICKCYDGYFGNLCDSNNVNSLLDEISSQLNSNTDNIELISNDNYVNLIKQMSMYLSQNHQFTESSNVIYDKIKQLTVSTITNFDVDTETLTNNFQTNIIEFIGFTLFYQKHNSNRRLVEEEELTSSNIHQFYKKLNSEKDSNLVKNTIVSSINNEFSYMLWDYKNKNYDEYILIMNNSYLPYLNQIENTNVNTFLHTIVK